MANSKMFAGRAPQAHGGMVELKDERWMMVWSGLTVSYSNDRGRTWSASEPLQICGEPIQIHAAGDALTAMVATINGNLLNAAI